MNKIEHKLIVFLVHLHTSIINVQHASIINIQHVDTINVQYIRTNK